GSCPWRRPISPFPNRDSNSWHAECMKTCSHGRQKEQNEEEFQTSVELARASVLRLGVVSGPGDQCAQSSAKRYPFPPASCRVPSSDSLPEGLSGPWRSVERRGRIRLRVPEG